MEFKLPELGENIESGDVINVLVHEGDTIQAQQGVVEIETDKAVVEIPSPQAGRVTKVHVQKGDKVPVGALLLTLEPAEAESPDKAKPATEDAPEDDAGAEEETESEDESESSDDEAAAPEPQPAKAKANGRKLEAAPAAATKQSVKKPPAATEPSQKQTTSTPKRASAAAEAARAPVEAEVKADTSVAPAENDDSERSLTPAGPATRRLARELGVELDQIAGTGPSGRITREDVVNAVRESNLQSTAQPATAGPRSGGATADVATAHGEREKRAAPPGVPGKDSWGAVRRAPLSKIRKTIAANMARSASTIPHVTNFDDADITELERIRKGSMADYVDQSVKLTLLPFVMKAVALSLRIHSNINASLDMESGEVVYKDYVNIGVAVDTERGLIVPVVREVDRLSIPQIAQALAKTAAQARGSQFTLDDLRGGTFTISNLGAIGGTYSTPIINYPEVAILLLGRSRRLPVVTAEDKVQVRLMCPLSISYDHRWVDGAAAARFLNDVKGYLEAPARLLLAP